ncbi:MAG: hypothetical protein ABII06_09210 [Pseudomonadota bacterium]
MNREGDVILIYYQDKPAGFARIEHIGPDVKKDWYRITLLLLTIPAQKVTWILREEYINGEEFTMGGQQMRLEKVKRVSLDPEEDDSGPVSEQKDKGKTSKVIPLKQRT